MRYTCTSVSLLFFFSILTATFLPGVATSEPNQAFSRAALFKFYCPKAKVSQDPATFHVTPDTFYTLDTDYGFQNGARKTGRSGADLRCSYPDAIELPDGESFFVNPPESMTWRIDILYYVPARPVVLELLSDTRSMRVRIPGSRRHQGKLRTVSLTFKASRPIVLRNSTSDFTARRHSDGIHLSAVSIVARGKSIPTPSPSVTATAKSTPPASPSKTATVGPTMAPSLTPTATAVVTVRATSTASPTATAAVKPTVIATSTRTPVPPTPTRTQTPVPSTPTPTQIPVSPTPKTSPTPAPQPTNTPTPMASPTPGGSNSRWAPTNHGRLFISGHSLTQFPYLADITSKNGHTYNYNKQDIPGAPLRLRTKGNDWSNPGWPGYSLGGNRDGSGMNVISELRNPQTLGPGERYNRLVIAERHDSASVIQWEDTVGFLKHYHDRFIAGNANGQTFFYHAWMDVNKNDPTSWIDHEKKTLGAWECVTSKVNRILESAGRSDRVLSLPAGGALVALVENALTNQVPGISGTTPERLGMIFSDNVHTTPLGLYYLSLVTHASTYGSSTIGIAPPPGLAISQATATALQQLAWTYVSSYYNRPNAGERTMEECRNTVMQQVCHSFYTLRGTPFHIQGCQNHFANSVFVWPDSGYVPWPAP